jgi:hypothetical protein
MDVTQKELELLSEHQDAEQLVRRARTEMRLRIDDVQALVGLQRVLPESEHRDLATTVALLSIDHAMSAVVAYGNAVRLLIEKSKPEPKP